MVSVPKYFMWFSWYYTQIRLKLAKIFSKKPVKSQSHPWIFPIEWYENRYEEICSHPLSAIWFEKPFYIHIYKLGSVNDCGFRLTMSELIQFRENKIRISKGSRFRFSLVKIELRENSTTIPSVWIGFKMDERFKWPTPFQMWLLLNQCISFRYSIRTWGAVCRFYYLSVCLHWFHNLISFVQCLVFLIS